MSETTIYISIAFIIIWTGFLFLFRKGKLEKTLISATALVLVFSEVLVADTGAILITQKNSDYTDNYDAYTQAIEAIEESDDGFYREELTYLETRMDPSYYGYNGMSVFSSMAYEDYSQLQYSLGMFGNRINSYTYNTQTPVYNMMFNIKYLIKSDVTLAPTESFYSELFTTDNGETEVYENKYYLPIAYAVNENINEWTTEEGNPLQFRRISSLKPQDTAECLKRWIISQRSLTVCPAKRLCLTERSGSQKATLKVLTALWNL